MPSLTIQLRVSADEMLKYYRGEAATVYATASNGRTVQFPASALRQHVTADGVHGEFRLEFDDNHKLVRLEQVFPDAEIDPPD